MIMSALSPSNTRVKQQGATVTSSSAARVEGGVVTGAENLNLINNHQAYYNQPQQQQFQDNINSYNQQHLHPQQQHLQATMNPSNYHLHEHSGGQHNKLVVDYDDNNMDANNIDENMTVPHPSVHQTTATTTGNSTAFGGHMGHPSAYHRQQQQPQHNYDSYYNQQPGSMDAQQQHHHHQQPPQQIDQHQQQQQDDVTSSLIAIVHDTQSIDKELIISRDVYQDFVLKVQLRGKLLHNLRHHEASTQPDAIERARRELNNFELSLRDQASDLNNIRTKILQQQMEIYDRLSEIQAKVLYEYLPKWHRDQQYSNNGVKIECRISLDVIQTWVEKMVDISWRLRNQNRGLKLTVSAKPNIPFPNDKLDRFSFLINKSLETLILNSFVVEKQPPQVMKTNTRFTSTVRFLVGGRLNVQMINPCVKAIILSESNARAIIQRHKEMIDSSWAYLSEYQLDQQASPTTPGVISPPLNYSPAQQQQQAVHQFIQQQQFVQQPASQQQQQLAMTLGQTNQLAAHQQNLTSTSAAVNSLSSSMAYQQLQQQQPLDFQNKVLNINDFDPSGEIVNNSNPLEYQEPSGQLLAQFRNMQLRKIKRTEKKGTESVMDEKFVLLFATEFRIADSNADLSSSGKQSGRHPEGDLSFQLMAFSLPAVVIVHGNQEPHAWATVTWHNAFATQDEILYRVPDKVSWRELGAVLSEKFKNFSGKGLNKHNLDYLASKVYRSHVSNDDVLVSWNQFAKEPLPDRSFTFWEWFHSIQKLTKEHLRDLWNADRIYGFVGKKGCIDLLLGSACHEPAQVGTFLLRFSETELGGITIAWVSPSSHVNKNETSVQISQRLSPSVSSPNVLMHLQPFTSKDLNTRSLADRIRDLKDLVYLYPEISKDEAFKSYYTPLNETSHMTNGYVRPMLIQTLVTNYPKDVAAATSSTSGGGGGGSGLSQTNSMDCAATPSPPNSFSQSSPDGIYHDNAMLNTMDANYPPSYDY